MAGWAVGNPPAYPPHQRPAERFEADDYGAPFEIPATDSVRVRMHDAEGIPHLHGALDPYGFNDHSSTCYRAVVFQGLGSDPDRFE